MKRRAFEVDRDYELLRKFLARMRAEYGKAAFFHYGDLVFRIHKASNHFDSERDIVLWEDKGEIVGFVFYTAVDANPEYMIDPKVYDILFEEVVQWSVERGREDGIKVIETGCIDGDTMKKAMLCKLGFAKFDDPYVFMVRDMNESLPEYELPMNYSFGTAKEYQNFFGISDEETDADYTMMVNAPGYMDQLGIRVFYQMNEIAAGGICWFDYEDYTAEFEPIGTNELHRRKGLAFSMMAEMLRRVKLLGAKEVYVKTGKTNYKAVKLYEKLGFRITHEDIGYSLRT